MFNFGYNILICMGKFITFLYGWSFDLKVYILIVIKIVYFISSELWLEFR